MKIPAVLKLIVIVPLGICVAVFLFLFVLFGTEELKKDYQIRNATPPNFAAAVCSPYTSDYAIEDYIEKGANVNELVPMEGKGQVPLITYVTAGCTNVDAVRLILKRGARIEDASLAGAARLGHEAMARMLIEAGASLGKQANGEGDAVSRELMLAAVTGNQPWLAQKLAQRGQSVKILDTNGRSLLAMALAQTWDTNTRELAKLVNVLIKAGAPVNAPGENLLSLVLNVNERAESAELVKLLIAAGAHIDPVSPAEMPALYWAAQDSKLAELDLLLAAGAKVDALAVTDPLSRITVPPGARVTALSHAVEGCHIEAVNRLLKKGASKSVVIEDGRALGEGACRYNGHIYGKREKIVALLAK